MLTSTPGRGGAVPVDEFTGAVMARLVGVEAGTTAEIDLPPPGWAHRHTFYQIVYVAEGRGVHHIDCEAYELHPGTLFFLRPEQVHSWDYADPPTGVIIVFTEEFLHSQRSREDVSRVSELFNDLADVGELRLAPTDTRRIVPILKDIVREYRAGEDDCRSVMQAHLHIFLARAHRLLPGSSERRMTSRSTLLVRQFTELVTQRRGPFQTVRQYSESLGVTPSHLAETVKSSTGRTPGQIIRGAQTVEAQRLLLHTDKNIAQIAYELGFKDTAYFGRFFKRETGVTPGEFRRSAREVAAA
jgi:AraC-like DNA-binding protein/quercetin dioxygenase-like cupin family protein